MYLQNRFLLDLEFHQIGEEAKKSAKYPKFMVNIPNNIKKNDVISGCFEIRKNHKTIFLTVLQQGNAIVLQSEKKGQPINVMRLDGNSFSSVKLMEKLIKTYVDESD